MPPLNEFHAVTDVNETHHVVLDVNQTHTSDVNETQHANTHVLEDNEPLCGSINILHEGNGSIEEGSRGHFVR